MFSIQENLHGSNLAKTSSQILIYQPHNQLLQAMKNDNYQVTYINFAREQILFLTHYLN